MQETLLIKLLQYITTNNPDLVLTLQEDGRITIYLQDKIDSIHILIEELIVEGTEAYMIEEACMEALTRDLRPSKYNYLIAILEEEFEADHDRLLKSGILIYEIINLIAICTPLFALFRFSEDTEDDKNLRYAVIGEIEEYFKNS